MIKINFKTLKHLFLYGIFGILTTLFNIFLYYFFTRIFNFDVVFSTILAWVCAVLFAYYTNKKYVFESKTDSLNAKIHEIFYFFLCRFATGFIDVIIMYIFVSLLAFNDVIIKTVSNIIVIIFNYIGSKIFVFNNSKKS